MANPIINPLIEKIRSLQQNYTQRTGINVKESLKDQSLSSFFLKKSDIQQRATQIRFLETIVQLTQECALFDEKMGLAVIIAGIDFIQKQISKPQSCLAELLEQALLTVAPSNTQLSVEEYVVQAQQFIENNAVDITKAASQYGLHLREWNQFVQHMDSQNLLTTNRSPS